MNIESLHNLFLKHNSVCTDTRKLKEGDLFFALKGDNFNGNLFAEDALNNGAAFAIIDEQNNAEDNRYILVEDVLTTLQQLAKYHRQQLGTKIIALTGSNGKTTTKELIQACLSKTFNTIATIGNLNNHIGVPLTLLRLNPDTDFGIIEMGANHPKEIAFLCELAEPDYGYITNFGKAHLEGFGSLKGVIRSKSELYDHLINSDGLIFLNALDPVQLDVEKKYKKVVMVNDPKSEDQFECLATNPFVKIKINETVIESQLIGAYNFNNISAAISIGRYFGIPDLTIKQAIESYRPTNNRSQIVMIKNKRIILDAYNANPTSMEAAITNFSESNDDKMVILGDMFELGGSAPEEHQNIADFALAKNINSIYLVGENFYGVHSTSDKVQKFKSFDALKSDLEKNPIHYDSILIKGSRGMALERVLELI